MELSDEEKAFIEKYQTEIGADSEKSNVRKRVKLTNLFYAWMGFLAIAPMVAITLFLVTMARFGRSYEESGLETIAKNQSDKEILETVDGFQGVTEVVGVYESRYEIALGIAAAFIAIMVVSVLLRVIVLAALKGKETNE